MGYFSEATESASNQKTAAEKVAETASTNLSTQSWTEHHDLANKAYSSFNRFDRNDDGVLNQIDFDFMRTRFGEYSQSERNAAKYLEQNFYAIRDMFREEEAGYKLGAGISVDDARRLYYATRPEFSARIPALRETMVPTALLSAAGTVIGVAGVGNVVIGLEAMSVVGVLASPLLVFGGALAVGGALTLGAGALNLFYYNRRVRQVNENRQTAGSLTIPNNLER